MAKTNITKNPGERGGPDAKSGNTSGFYRESTFPSGSLARATQLASDVLAGSHILQVSDVQLGGSCISALAITTPVPGTAAQVRFGVYKADDDTLIGQIGSDSTVNSGFTFDMGFDDNFNSGSGKSAGKRISWRPIKYDWYIGAEVTTTGTSAATAGDIVVNGAVSMFYSEDARG